MKIGIFRKAENGYIGKLTVLGMNSAALAIIPSVDSENDFEVFIVNDDDAALQCGEAKMTGTAKRKDREAQLKVLLDCPSFRSPVIATMSVRPDEDNLYWLSWQRTAASKSASQNRHIMLPHR